MNASANDTALPPLDALRAPLDGTTLIEASAGTGKTHTIATLVLRLLLEKGLSIAEILVVTYTRAATAELRQRVRARLAEAVEVFELATLRPAELHALLAAQEKDERDTTLAKLALKSLADEKCERDKRRLLQALREFDRASIFTIHGFCQRVLRISAFESGSAFDLSLLEDQRGLILEVVQDYWARTLYDAPEAFAARVRADANLGLEPLTRLVRRALANPDLVVIPEVTPPELAPLLTACGTSLWRVDALFAAHGAEVQALLENADLSGGVYNSKWFAKVFVGLRAGDHRMPGVVPDWFERLTNAKLKHDKSSKKGTKYVPSHPFFDACDLLFAANNALAQALRAQLLAFEQGVVEYARSELSRRKAELDLQGFDDLLERLRAAIQGESGHALLSRVRELHPAALIDEFQDTDPVQCEVFARIYDEHAPAPGALFLIGDPKQAIYGFRGADVFAYMAAARTQSTRAYTLGTNYRSDPSLLRAIDAVFGRGRTPFVFPEIRFQPAAPRPGASDGLVGTLQGSAPLEVLFVPRPDVDRGKGIDDPFSMESIARHTAAELTRLLQAGGALREAERVRAIEPRDIAVLCRTNAQAKLMQTALRERGVPSVLDGDSSVFESEMARELERVLAAMIEPSDQARVRGALVTSLLGHDARQLLELEREESLSDDWLERFQGFHRVWETRGFMQAFHAFLDSEAVPARLLQLLDGERRMTDLFHLAELLHAQALRARLGPLSLLDWYRRVCHDDRQRATMALDSAQIRLESDARAVTLTTIHKSKGLEYPIVYCPFLWHVPFHAAENKRPLFHDPEHGLRLTLDLDGGSAAGAEHAALQQRETLAENLRLLYVALTRAKHRLSLVWGAFATVRDSALGYLLHQPRQLAFVDDLATATKARIMAASDDELLADLSEVEEQASGAIQVTSWRTTDPGRYEPPLTAAPQLHARIAQHERSGFLRTSSFSRLTSGHEPTSEAVALDEARDHDEEQEALTAPVEPTETPTRVALADFPNGATPGQLIHEIYEHIDFRAASAAEVLPEAERALRVYGFDATLAPQLATSLWTTLSTPIDARGLTSLSVLAPHDRLTELEFMYPVASHSAIATALTRERLAAVLERHATTLEQRSYAQRVRQLGFAPLCGFLRGFIDLVARHRNRFYLIDYKSNHLGPLAHDYRPARLSDVMQRHHYTLQYLLYSVALHRYLTLRLPDYDYDKNFGAVYYLFVRGMGDASAIPKGMGVFRDRPSRGLIEELSQLLAADTPTAELSP